MTQHSPSGFSTDYLVTKRRARDAMTSAPSRNWSRITSCCLIVLTGAFLFVFRDAFSPAWVWTNREKTEYTYCFQIKDSSRKAECYLIANLHQRLFR
jgi:hypothetical protein